MNIWQAGLDSVRGDPLVASKVSWDGSVLTIANERFDLAASPRIVIVGAGKATLSLAQGLVRILEQKPTKFLTGWINVPESDSAVDVRFPIHVHFARPHGVNEPTPLAELGANKILEMVASCSPKDTVICLISGGGSALLPAPRKGISLEDKIRVTQFLSGAGCTIQELNTVRRSLSRIKAGGLARACNAGKLITLVLSDVLGDPMEFIASGPTELEHPPDYIAALDIINRVDPERLDIPKTIFDLLENDVANPISISKNTVAKVRNIILGNNATAIDAATQMGLVLGYQPESHSMKHSEGDVVELAKYFSDRIVDACKSGRPLCLIHGGEPTVVLPPKVDRGMGGRNQQLALCVLRELIAKRSDCEFRDVLFLSAGTDGEDGPTFSAGAWIDSKLVHEMVDRIDLLDDHISRCDAYHFFQWQNKLFTTGPTGTNVCDIRVAIVK